MISFQLRSPQYQIANNGTPNVPLVLLFLYCFMTGLAYCIYFTRSETSLLPIKELLVMAF